MNFIITVVGFVVILVGMFLIVASAKERETGKQASKPFYLPVIGLCLIIFAASFRIVPTGYTGIRITFGQVSEDTVPNGFAWKIPFVQKIKLMNNKQQDITYDGQIWSETSERTALYYEGITITYQISKDKSAWIYSNVSNYSDSLITQNIVASSIKTASKELNSIDATNRGIIEPKAMQEMQTLLDAKYGEGTIVVIRVTIANADFEKTYNEAIAQKQNAQLEYERQQIENQKSIEAAEAAAKVKLTQANAEAEAKLIEAQAEAEANKIIADSLSEDIFKNLMMEKWNGELPKVTGNGNYMFDLSQLMGSNTVTE